MESSDGETRSFLVRWEPMPLLFHERARFAKAFETAGAAQAALSVVLRQTPPWFTHRVVKAKEKA